LLKYLNKGQLIVFGLGLKAKYYLFFPPDGIEICGFRPPLEITSPILPEFLFFKIIS
jgi:hypothetical protein